MDYKKNNDLSLEHSIHISSYVGVIVANTQNFILVVTVFSDKQCGKGFILTPAGNIVFAM